MVDELGWFVMVQKKDYQGAVDALEDTPGIRVKAVSPVYETEPWGVEPGSQPSYFSRLSSFPRLRRGRRGPK